MTRPLKKTRLETPLETWCNMVVRYRMMKDGSLEMTLKLKNGRVRFQLAPDGVWRRRIRRRGANYWRRANAWDALQCRLSYNSYRDAFPRAPGAQLNLRRLTCKSFTLSWPHTSSA